MATPQVPNLNLPSEIHAIFCAGIDQGSIGRIFAAVATASQNDVKHIHLLFQSLGGSVSDGIALYNFFKTASLDITLYNVGSVQSAAAIAYLGARKRKTSARATFVFHRVKGPAQAAVSSALKIITESVVLDDNRTESIMREHIQMPDEKWAVLNQGDLWFTAEDAVATEIAHEIAEFAPPVGGKIFNL